MPKALIVGTSNSVRGSGYVKHLADQLGGEDQIRNASLGASASTHVIRSLKGVDFAAFDYCVIDLSVNEDVLLRAGAMEPETSRTVIDAIVGAALAAGCLPIILILPRRMQEGQTPAGRPLHLEHARRWKLPVFDGYVLLDRLRGQGGVDDDDIFRNAAHIDNWVAAVVGRNLADFMVAHEKARWAPARKTITFPVLGEVILHGPERPGMERSTSKFSGSFVQLSSGEVLKASLGDMSGVLGLAVNLAQTHGVVRLSGDREVLMDLRSSYFQNPDHPLVISSMPLPSRLAPDPSGCVAVSVVAAEALEAGADLHSAVEELGEAAADAPAQLEIEALQGVVAMRTAEAYAPRASLHAEIFQGHRMALADLAAAVYRDTVPADTAAAKAETKRQRKRERALAARALKQMDPAELAQKRQAEAEEKQAREAAALAAKEAERQQKAQERAAAQAAKAEEQAAEKAAARAAKAKAKALREAAAKAAKAEQQAAEKEAARQAKAQAKAEREAAARAAKAEQQAAEKEAARRAKAQAKAEREAAAKAVKAEQQAAEKAAARAAKAQAQAEREAAAKAARAEQKAASRAAKAEASAAAKAERDAAAKAAKRQDKQAVREAKLEERRLGRKAAAKAARQQAKKAERNAKAADGEPDAST